MVQEIWSSKFYKSTDLHSSMFLNTTWHSWCCCNVCNFGMKLFFLRSTKQKNVLRKLFTHAFHYWKTHEKIEKPSQLETSSFIFSTHPLQFLLLIVWLSTREHLALEKNVSKYKHEAHQSWHTYTEKNECVIE